jgi:Na+/proline symporter
MGFLPKLNKKIVLMVNIIAISIIYCTIADIFMEEFFNKAKMSNRKQNMGYVIGAYFFVYVLIFAICMPFAFGSDIGYEVDTHIKKLNNIGYEVDTHIKKLNKK